MNTINGRNISREVLEAYRFRALTLRYELGYSVRKISEVFGIHYNSISRWFCKYRKEGEQSLRRTYAPGAKRKLDNKIMKWLSKTLMHPANVYGFQTPLWTGTFIRILLRREKKILLDRTTIWRYLIRMGFSFHKPGRRYSQQDKGIVEQWIKAEWPRIQKWAKKHRAILYFEDESGISLVPAIGKTWSPKGTVPIIKISGARGGVLAMSAISPTGRMCFKLEKRKINADVLIEFLTEIGNQHKRRKLGIIMDQAPSHIAKKVRQFSEHSKRIKIFYIPPYSPELDPDEKVWRHLKHISLKNHQAQNKNQLTRLVLIALRKIQNNPALIRNFFANYLT